MTMLVTLDEAKEHLRVTYDTEDDGIVRKIEDASNRILLHVTDASFVDTNGEPDETMPPVVRQATLQLVELLFRNRGGEDWDSEPNYLPHSIQALLYPLRDPTMA